MAQNYCDIFNNCKNIIVSKCENRADFESYLNVSRDRIQSTFTRSRVLTLTNLTWTLVCRLSKSIQVELDEILPSLTGRSATKSALSHRRTDIKAEFYKMLSDKVTDYLVSALGDRSRTWKGHPLVAVDGTGLMLPDHEELVDEYGRYDAFGNKNNPVSARGLVIEDILNGIILGMDISRYHTDERRMLVSCISEIEPTKSGGTPIIICDRGYFSYALMDFLDRSGYKYVIRMPTGGFSTANQIRSGSLRDGTLTIRPSATVKTIDSGEHLESITYRFVKVRLDTGEDEILLTNLDAAEASSTDLYELYGLRWKVEILIDRLKNNIEIEHLSGIRPIAVEQDFFASAITYNLAAILSFMVEDAYAARHSDKPLRKLHYKPNMAVVIGLLCYYLPELMRRRVKPKLLSSLTLMLTHAMTPEIPDRKFSRKKKHKNRQGRFFTEPAFKQTL